MLVKYILTWRITITIILQLQFYSLLLEPASVLSIFASFITEIIHDSVKISIEEGLPL